MSDKDTELRKDEQSEQIDAPESDAEMATPEAPEATRPRITPIRIAIAIAAVAASYSCIDTVRMAMAEPRVAFDTIDSVADIDSGIAQAGTLQDIVPLTVGDGAIDILYVGAPECIHCQNFVNGKFEDYPEHPEFTPTSLDALVDAAQEQNLDLAYMPMAFSQLGVVLAAGETCAAPVSSLSSPERVKAAYALMPSLADASEDALELMKSGGDPQQVQSLMVGALEDMHETLAPDGLPFDQTCFEEAATAKIQKMTDFAEVFGQHGTPSFFFMGDDGAMHQFSGAGGVAPMLRQVAR